MARPCGRTALITSFVVDRSVPEQVQVLAQAQEAYEYNNAAAKAPATCSCKHICNVRCVQRNDSAELPHCYMGPGLAAAWLTLRAAGLAEGPQHALP